MFSLASITLIKFNFGPSVTAIGKLGWTGGEPTKSQIAQLKVPWQKLQPDPTLFSLLSWHTRISEFAGRYDEMDQLREWATTDLPVSVRFVVGEGGVGKSRLGAEFAETMQKDDWAAGFVDPRKQYAFPMHKAGTLLVIDYPEEHVKRVADLLTDLTQVGLDGRLRVLFLTRQTLDNWDETISSANADNIVDRYPVILGRLDAHSATTVFNTTATEAIDRLQTDSAQEAGKALIHEEAMAQWLKDAPENDRALFIMAAAVYSAKNPEEELVKYTGREIVKAIAKRETDRYQRMAEERNLKDKYALARLLAIIAIADDLSVADIKNIIAECDLPLGLRPSDDITDHLTTTGLLIDGKVRAPKPDIVAAAFVVYVLSRRPEHAPETVWAALKGDIEGGLERFGRLSYDSEFVLGILEHRLSDWLAQAVDGNIERCRIIESSFEDVDLPVGWLRAAIAVLKTVLRYTDDDMERAPRLGNLSNHLDEIGKKVEALSVSQEAVAIHRRIAEANPTQFEPNLAVSLNNLCTCLCDAGDIAGALATVRESIEISRRLVKVSPVRFERYLASSLNNLSQCLRRTNNPVGALKAAKESVEIHRRLEKTNAELYETRLASALNTLSNRFAETGQSVAALTAIREAVMIRRRLSETNPARFGPSLVGVVSNLSGRLAATGDLPGALTVIQEAVRMYRGLVKANPSVFDFHLSRCLGRLGLMLMTVKRPSDAVAAIKEGVTLIRPYAEKWPGSQHERLLKALEDSLKKALGESES